MISEDNIFNHDTVLPHDAVIALVHNPDGCYVDATFGRGGHSRLILDKLSANGRLIVIDKDADAITEAENLAQQDSRVLPWRGSFGDVDQALSHFSIEQIDGLLMDLGVSSPQLDDASRGFSFQRDGALDMRMSKDVGQTAAEWLNHVTEEALADVLWRYGEERHSRRLAKAILEKQAEKPLQTTLELANLIAKVMPGKREKGKHPATRSFQAIRIYINNELGDLQRCLQLVPDVFKANARLVTISFHSLEDRIVKRFIKQQSELPSMPRGLPVEADRSLLTMRRIGKPVKPPQAEVTRNVRARSAIMRVAERL